MYEQRHIFNSEINNTSVRDFRNLDYQITNLKDRKKEVEELLNNDNDFFTTYFDEFYKDNIGASDELSEKNTVCKTLEGLANYLLGSQEIREERKNSKTNYKFYVDEAEFKIRTNKELPMTNLTYESNSSDIEKIDNVIHFLKQSKKNFKKEKTLNIQAKDLKRNDYCSEILKDYNVLKEFLTEEIKRPNKFKGKRQKLTAMKHTVEDDMLYTKEHLLGIFGQTPRNLLHDSTKPDWDSFNYKNVEHMKKLIYINSDFNPNDEISYFLIDLNTLYLKCKEDKSLTEEEIKIYNLIRSGYKNVEIANIFNVDRYVITRKVNTIIKKICKKAEKLGW